MKLRNKKTGEEIEVKLKLNEDLIEGIHRTLREHGWEK
jgi:hypothetical protein